MNLIDINFKALENCSLDESQATIKLAIKRYQWGNDKTFLIITLSAFCFFISPVLLLAHFNGNPALVLPILLLASAGINYCLLKPQAIRIQPLLNDALTTIKQADKEYTANYRNSSNAGSDSQSIRRRGE